MAGLKKKKQEKGTSPNVVLVIFLVFMFLVSVGLGVWGYYGYAGQADLLKAKEGERAKAAGENVGRRFYTTLYQYSRLASGEKLDEKEATQFNDNYEELFVKPEGGVFKGENERDAGKAFIAKLKKTLRTDDA